MNRFKDLLDKKITAWYEPVFSDLNWTGTLTEWETKTLIEIACARTIEKLKIQ
jgi:hypothetical protein